MGPQAALRKTLIVILLLGLGTVAVLLIYGLGRVDDPSLAPAYDATKAAPAPSRERAHGRPEKNVFFGDLHVHTSLSSDAYIFGVRAMPDDAYTYAKGGTIEHGAGYPIRIDRPLDFLAVTDHAEYLGSLRASDADIPTNRIALRKVLLESNRITFTRYWAESVSNVFGAFRGTYANPSAERAAWSEIIAAAQRHDDPGAFTAFIGYEWSSQGIHRNVIYGSASVPERPFSSVDSQRPQDLWRALEDQNSAGQPVLAIPHNGNESGGRIYPAQPIEELEWTAEEADRRNRIEPITEIYQIKGSSETHPELSPEDRFADFEIIDLPAYRGESGGPAGSYARDALRTGLELSLDEGWNPYRLGFVGSTDSHNASSPIEESRHHGKLPVLDGSAAIRLGEALLVPNALSPGGTWGGGGLAGVWAEENTRASLFAALQRRETFATSGPRIGVRIFAGWSFDNDDLRDPDLVRRAYREGVPMGGVLPQRSPGARPRLLVWADMDPASAQLDRIQIIKGGIDETGRSYERVFDVAASGARTRDPQTGQFPPVGNTVDVENATWTNTIGAAHLEALWIDEEFDSERDAFYYVRVLEIPTPRRSTYDAKLLGVDAPDPTTIQERAATSAIWYEAPPVTR